MPATSVAPNGESALTAQEVGVMEALVNAHDRAGFYTVYNAMMDSGEAMRQSRIASFSGFVGGVAYGANRLMQVIYGPGTGSDPEYSGIYFLSQKVAESALTTIKATAKRTQVWSAAARYI
jgi:hypothetical protein